MNASLSQYQKVIGGQQKAFTVVFRQLEHLKIKQISLCFQIKNQHVVRISSNCTKTNNHLVLLLDNGQVYICYFAVGLLGDVVKGLRVYVFLF